MRFKEKVASIGKPLSDEEVEDLFFNMEERFIGKPLGLVREKIEARRYLEELRDELLADDQNPVITETLSLTFVKPRSLVKTILESASGDILDERDKRRWCFTQITPEKELELSAKLIDKYGLDSLIEKPEINPGEYTVSRDLWTLEVVVALNWEEDNTEHMVSFVGGHFYNSGTYWLYIKNQNLEEELIDFNHHRKSSDEVEEILAHAFLMSEFDPEKERGELEGVKAEIEGSRVTIVPIPVPINASPIPQVVTIWRPPDYT